jgi:ribosomal protein S18 acetylase RimI-like enzyme
VLRSVRGLSGSDLSALADLERRTLACDGGRLKLEWGVLRARSGGQVEDLLWEDSGRLVGYAGLYGFGPPTVEVAGMVDPAARRQGIGTALLDAALEQARSQGYRQALLVVPNRSSAGRSFALSRGATLQHSEHALVLRDPPAEQPPHSRVQLRTATPDDAVDVQRLLAAGFGRTDLTVPPGESLTETGSETLVATLDGVPVGTVRLTLAEHVGGIYGFVVDPARQGRGIGREILRQACARLRADGAGLIRLEVAVDNPRALGLYTSLGFVPDGGEDYYSVPLSG